MSDPIKGLSPEHLLATLWAASIDCYTGDIRDLCNAAALEIERLREILRKDGKL